MAVDPAFPNAINHTETFKNEKYSEAVKARLIEAERIGGGAGKAGDALKTELRKMGKDMLFGNKFW